MPVAVVIEKTASSAPPRLFVQKPGGLRYVRKRAVAIVAVKDVLSEVGAKNIFKPVVIVVPDANARSPADGTQARLFCNVRERPITIVLVQSVRGLGRSAFEPGATQQKNIHPSIVVIINERAAASGGF